MSTATIAELPACVACDHEATEHKRGGALRPGTPCTAEGCNCAWYGHAPEQGSWARRHRLEIAAIGGFPVGYGLGAFVMWQWGDALRTLIWG